MKTLFANIYENIAQQLHDAQQEILVAMAWFTDPDLMHLLAEKAKAGLRVEVALADNEENRNAPFSIMEGANIPLFWIPAKGYGTMHYKFCVIDRKKVIAGSYNWTINARKNNSENVNIFENDASANEYLQQFEKIKTGEPAADMPPAPIPAKNMKSENEPQTISVISSFDEEWRVFINSQVREFNAEALTQEGHNRAQTTLGDISILPNAFDAIYSQLLQDTEVDADKAIMLRKRLDQRISLYKDDLQAKHVRDREALQHEALGQEKSLMSQMNVSKMEQEQCIAKKDTHERQRIPDAEQEKQDMQREIDQAKLDQVVPPMKKRVWGVVVLFLAISAFLWLFYASVMYTVMYGAEDAMANAEQGIVKMVELFNADALSLAWNRGWGAVFFSSLIVVVPLAFGYLFHRLESNRQGWAYLSFAVIFDVIVAYQLAKASHEIRRITGLTDEEWRMDMVIGMGNFWLVLIMGVILYLAWGAFLEILWKEFDRVSKSEHFNRQQLKIAQLSLKVQEKDEEIKALKQEVAQLEQDSIRLKGQIKQLEQQLHFLPGETKRKENALIDELKKIEALLDRQFDKMASYLERNRIPVSNTSLRARMNAFLRGWDQWIYSYYSTALAQKRVEDSHRALDQWLNQKISELE